MNKRPNPIACARMIVLGLDTTGPFCSVSLVDETRILAHISRRIGRGHAEILASQIEELFQKAGIKPDDVDRVAVCSGPGSFTGLRVALSFAIGFALPRNLPVIGINALALSHVQLTTETDQAALIYQDVRRDEFMFAPFMGHTLETLTGDLPQTGSWDDVGKLGEHFKLPLKAALEPIDTRILAWLSMALDPDDYPAEPLYARGPDAKLPGGKTLAETSV